VTTFFTFITEESENWIFHS